MLAFWEWVIILWIVSFIISRLTFKEWVSNIAFYGVRKLSRSMTKLSKVKGESEVLWWEPVFEYWWGFSIKYFVPFGLNFLIFFSLHKDINDAYGGYHIFWQVMGFLFPIAGILVYFFSFFLITTPEPFEHDVDAAFDDYDHAGVGADTSMAAITKVHPFIAETVPQIDK